MPCPQRRAAAPPSSAAIAASMSSGDKSSALASAGNSSLTSLTPEMLSCVALRGGAPGPRRGGGGVGRRVLGARLGGQCLAGVHDAEDVLVRGDEVGHFRLRGLRLGRA